MYSLYRLPFYQNRRLLHILFFLPPPFRNPLSMTCDLVLCLPTLPGSSPLFLGRWEVEAVHTLVSSPHFLYNYHGWSISVQHYLQCWPSWSLTVLLHVDSVYHVCVVHREEQHLPPMLPSYHLLQLFHVPATSPLPCLYSFSLPPTNIKLLSQ